MGSYASLYVDSFSIRDFKSFVDPAVMVCFRASDRRVYRTTESKADGNLRRLLPDQGPPADGASADEDPWYDQVDYAVAISTAKDRLELMGFTLEAARLLFHQGIHNRIAKLRRWAADDTTGGRFTVNASDGTPRTIDLRADRKHEAAILESATFEAWQAEFLKLKTSGGSRYELPADSSDLARVLFDRDDDFYLGFPLDDPRFFLRAVVETSQPDGVLVLDISELVSNGYYDIEADHSSAAIVDGTISAVINERVVVLTEGKTDRTVLRESLSLLYPHLSDYFTFMDFDAVNAAGGASQAVATLKALIGAKIANRIVAIFDNDTAAKDALRGFATCGSPRQQRF